MVPPATEKIVGCAFEPRCPRAMKICREQQPQLLEAAPDHRVACWLYGEK
jgi:oligopeptide/dipeptide ABC transporter ATP-binding protein